jgi:hypothetical protein
MFLIWHQLGKKFMETQRHCRSVVLDFPAGQRVTEIDLTASATSTMHL